MFCARLVLNGDLNLTGRDQSNSIAIAASASSPCKAAGSMTPDPISCNFFPSDNAMTLGLSTKIAFWLYNLVWGIAIPWLRLNRRLAQGFAQRKLSQVEFMRADLWIQAASAGEAFLAWELLRKIKPKRPLGVLLTSNTTQGIEILRQAIAERKSHDNMLDLQVTYFPFDKPAIMHSAVTRIKPGVMVLLEAELWPGHLLALKTHGCRIVIVNGRLTQRSLAGYCRWPSIWRLLKPDKILAISENDAGRFSTLFGPEGIELMPNIKFDRISTALKTDTGPAGQIEKMLPRDAPFVTLGSIRRPEEMTVKHIITELLRSHPEAVIGLFPRHLQRTTFWQETLTRLDIRWFLRSTTQTQIPPGSVILWDTFGELPTAYRYSTAAFVGGSLAPLGGQNFLETLACGVIPVTGPSWENFAWVGRDIISSGLLKVAKDGHEVARRLIEAIEQPASHQQVSERVNSYLKDRQGGTEMACRAIMDLLEPP